MIVEFLNNLPALQDGFRYLWCRTALSARAGLAGGTMTNGTTVPWPAAERSSGPRSGPGGSPQSP